MTSHDSRVGWVNRETAATPIANLPIADVIKTCDELANREFQSFTERDPFHGLVEANLKKAMAVLIFEARRSNFPSRYWSTILTAWPKKTSVRRITLMAEVVATAPPALLNAVRFELGHWISSHLPKIDHRNRKIAWKLYDRVVTALEQGGSESLKSGLGTTSVGGVEIPSNRMGINYAINSPSGDLAQALINVLFARKPKPNQRLAADLKKRIQRLLKLAGEGSQNALTIVARQIHALYVIDRTWTKKHLLLRFDPTDPIAEAAWAGLIASMQMPSPALFKELKLNFLKATATSSKWTFEGLSHLGDLLILALNPPSRQRTLISSEEARDALRKASPEIRQQALFFLRSQASQSRDWKRLIVPFFRNIWPRERKFQTQETSHTLVMFLEDLGPHFPDGVDLVSAYLVPSANIDVLVYQFGKDKSGGRPSITTKYPFATLTLLSKVVDETLQNPPYGLSAVLSKIVEVAPELRHDERWQRLHRMTLT